MGCRRFNIITHYASRCIRPSHVCPTSLSHATILATFQLFHPALPLSLLTVLPQVVFGLPPTPPSSGVHPNTIKQLFTPSLLSSCPNQFHFLLCILKHWSLPFLPLQEFPTKHINRCINKLLSSHKVENLFLICSYYSLGLNINLNVFCLVLLFFFCHCCFFLSCFLLYLVFNSSN